MSHRKVNIDGDLSPSKIPHHSGSFVSFLKKNLYKIDTTIFVKKKVPNI
jgi:hypothetical protein